MAFLAADLGTKMHSNNRNLNSRTKLSSQNTSNESKEQQ